MGKSFELAQKHTICLFIFVCKMQKYDYKLDFSTSSLLMYLTKLKKIHKVLFWYLKSLNYVRTGQGVWPKLRKRPTQRLPFRNRREIKRLNHTSLHLYAECVDYKLHDNRLRRVAVFIRQADRRNSEHSNENSLFARSII